jgi:hypothetical protein
MAEEMRQTIDAEGYGLWPPLSPITVKKKGFDDMLVEEYVMRSRIRPRKYGAIDPTRRTTQVGLFPEDDAERTRYAWIHEFGSEEQNIPQRSFIRFTFDLLEHQGRLTEVPEKLLKMLIEEGGLRQ